MKIQVLKIDALKPYERNPKLHPESQIEGLSESIRRFGFIQPLVIDSKNVVVIGHGRLEAAKQVGLKEVPCVKVSDLSDKEIRALRLIDNRIAETGWDLKALGVELEDFDFDFEPFNISFDEFASSEGKEGLTDPDAVPEAPKNGRVKLGDVWECDKHRVMCGDSTNKEMVENLLSEVKPNLMVTDPPYGVEYDPKWRLDAGINKIHQKRSEGKVNNGTYILN